MAVSEPARDKQAVREDVWSAMERAGAARFPGAKGRIPNFAGAERAAERLAETPEWKAARVIKANPDAPQLPVRARALAEGKVVYVAVPRLAEARPFIELDPGRIAVAPRKAVSIKGSARHGRPVAVADVRRVDLIVCGTVAVNREGVRVGKGGGYSDLEFALLHELGAVDERTVIATTVHPLQVLGTGLPETEHDFRVDLIVTPDEVIRPGRRARPPGVTWEHLDEGKIEAIPALAAMARGRGGRRYGKA